MLNHSAAQMLITTGTIVIAMVAMNAMVFGMWMFEIWMPMWIIYTLISTTAP